MKRSLFSLTLIACQAAYAAPEPKTNIIFLVGDGMGVPYTTAYRLYDSEPGKSTPSIFDSMLVGMASTYPEDPGQVTDSAAAATALSSGIKTYNGAIGINSQHQPVQTILEKAKTLGYLTGIAVTCQVNHATPAAFIAHADSRLSYDKIADQYLDSRINGKPKVDLILGGGQEYFIRKDRNLIKEFANFGYSYHSNVDELKNIKKLPAIGLFAKSGMEPALESSHPLRLAEMTEKSLSLLQNPNQPFLLMLEASQIDWCGHANDVACAMGEVRDMAATIKIIKAFIDKNPNTIFVATADHSTGGLTIGAKGQYQWGAKVLRNVKATAPSIARQLLASKNNWRNEWQRLTQIDLADDEQKALDALITQPEGSSDIIASQITAQVLTLIDKYTATGWTSKGHTGEDVQVFAYGKGKQNFAGAQDNTDIAKKLFRYLEP